MTAALVLGINMSVAGIFAVAFGIVAVTNRTAYGAGWVAAGYATGVLDVLLEFALYWHAEANPFAIGIYFAFLVALALSLAGVAVHYRMKPPWRAIAVIGTVSCIAVPVIFSLPYGSMIRGLLYQLPYVAMQSLIGWTVVRSGRRQFLDLLLVALNGVAALIYLLKPSIASTVGTARAPQGYLTTDYAAISQSLGSVTLVALALVLLLIIMRDTNIELQARAEIDSLSGVFNRRGFDTHAELLLAEAQRSNDHLTLVTADLDYFKAVNDSFGHDVGDQVIAHFAALLQRAAPQNAIVSRLGGEEFAVVLASADLAFGREYAEGVREALIEQTLSGVGTDLTITASFGVAQLASGESLSELTRRADAALYRAKASGRDRVNLAFTDMSMATEVLPATKPMLALARRSRQSAG